MKIPAAWRMRNIIWQAKMQIVKKQTTQGGGGGKRGTRRGIKTNNCCTIAAACEGVEGRTGRGKWGIHIFDAEKHLQINCHSRQGERQIERGRGRGGNRETAAASQDPKMANKRSWPGCE